ncbi:hypothetical protein A2738_00345 [Candidatus Nomurabacteria bacterium RIFCSPHIGHO2_01_FULL_42_15]|uniref:Solute-binding protein family 5 domain-containing protein n=1 Tax=Candidatus Nomurabacteria bacterium RIFCSPHIGHO2_01_FULL_42_15 TaxID=1801742 RepID=A0A1F6VEF1_9BACT|nr:MAG: hypothetical protein A2738_00345 [Candidatus Nomurabacteria bacterium RIFCSPHIGHO2_01_FULL_42_15]OGI93264.1 MAG: hypothetical protein A3A99_03930 [Candidatus Nomurabacteria bacterium RIFCSPLOWO2_01_FULL_41_18]
MRNFKLPSKKEINFVFTSFSKKERVVFVGLVLVLFLSTFAILESINKFFMVQVPLRGGSISIGMTGVPRFINTVLANSEADLNLVSLVYSGLMRKSAEGNLIPDLAKEYRASEDGLTYTFTLKDDIYFHDGKPVTVEDILFTIDSVKNSIIESPHKVHWNGVSVSKIDDKTIEFTLRQAYALFLENTTIGIMPAHLWEGSPLELNLSNTSPVGSGPYMISSINKKSSGIIDNYKLVAFEKFALGEPYIKNMDLHFYQNEEDLVKALTDKKVDEVSSISSQNAEMLKGKNYQVESAVLPRVFGLFFNQNQNQLFIDKAIIKAINESIDKERIVGEVLLGYGTVIDGPIPPNKTEYRTIAEKTTLSRTEILQKVQADLAKAGWQMGEDGFLEKITTEGKKKTTSKLEFSISTGSVPELAKTAELIKEDLAIIGMKVDVKTFEKGNLNQNVIRPRQYDALLFGEIINSEFDLYAFWHSSQRNDPGLNVAMYTNAKVDKILEDASATIDEQSRIKKYMEFSDEIKKDISAVFLYSPDFIYTVSKDHKELESGHIISPADRYLNAYLWYSKTENVWKIFAR